MNQRKPEWLRIRAPGGELVSKVSKLLKAGGLHTVCDEARCPNKAECWGCGTATFMLMGDLCTRNCRFCAVGTGKRGRELDPREGENIGKAARELSLRYVVLTSVDRDDLPDGGAAHFASCVRAIRAEVPGVMIETLIPDYSGERLATLLESGPDVVAHNIETVARLQVVRDARAGYKSSLATIAAVSAAGIHAKSSIMVGLGETPAEVSAAMDDLRAAGCKTLVIGQYLRPTPLQLPVIEYVTPEQFANYRAIGLEKGFSAVVSAPLARTSYHAMASHEAALAGKASGDNGAGA